MLTKHQTILVVPKFMDKSYIHLETILLIFLYFKIVNFSFLIIANLEND